MLFWWKLVSAKGPLTDIFGYLSFDFFSNCQNSLLTVNLLMKDITDTVNDVCTDCYYVMGYNYVRAVGYCLYGTLLLRPCCCMSHTNHSSSSHRCLCRHQWLNMLCWTQTWTLLTTNGQVSILVKALASSQSLVLIPKQVGELLPPAYAGR